MARMGRISFTTPIKYCTALGVFLLCLGSLQQPAWAHGGVSSKEDLCVIEIGFFRAHFKVYLPELKQHEEFCEDLPAAGEAVFVMEYLHPSLDTVPVDFRIIRNETGMGRHTRLEDVEQLGNLDELTVFHRPAAVQADVFTVLHEFESAGQFVGIVTVQQPGTQRTYSTVFPFDVGFTGLGFGSFFILVVLAIHLLYLYMSGWFSRRRLAVGAIALALLWLPGLAGAATQVSSTMPGTDVWVSRLGQFRVAYESELEPLVINRIHNGVLRIESSAGEPIADAQIVITGGMPLHDHGLATQPQVTRYLGEGKYLVEGMRYHMHGAWELLITIEARGKKDTVVIPLQL